MNARKILVIAISILAPLAAQAQSASNAVSGLYLGVGFGPNFQASTSITGTLSNYSISDDGSSFDFKPGYAGLLSLGWAFGNGLRVEVEGNFRQNDVAAIKVENSAISGPTGKTSSYGAMGNILYDVHLGASYGGITPYLGLGIGYIWQKYDDAGHLTNRNGELFVGTSGALAGQAIAGLAIPVTSFPGLTLTAEYRFMATSGNKITSFYTVSSGERTRFSSDMDVNNLNHSILLGLRYAFNAAPAVAAAEPIAAAHTYLVFFDWNKADLTDRAKQIIGEAATGRGQGVTRIEVNGYTDRSGSNQYNQGLSVRRANAVAAELVRRGVLRNEIVTRGFGEANPLVPTADGVREPQNRRVEIILR